MKADIMIGIIGSGKSTLSAKLVTENVNAVIINKDSLRSMMKEKYTFDDNLERLIKVITGHIIFEALYARHDIIIDDDYIVKSKRIALIKYLREKFPSIQINAYVFKPGPWCLKRRLREPRGCSNAKWTEVYNGMLSSFELPDKSEGFNNITIMPDPKADEDVVTSLLRQRSFCKENDLPYLIPGPICPNSNCKNDLENDVYIIENAASKHITCCPKCNYAFND